MNIYIYICIYLCVYIYKYIYVHTAELTERMKLWVDNQLIVDQWVSLASADASPAGHITGTHTHTHTHTQTNTRLRTHT